MSFLESVSVSVKEAKAVSGISDISYIKNRKLPKLRAKASGRSQYLGREPVLLEILKKYLLHYVMGEVVSRSHSLQN